MTKELIQHFIADYYAGDRSEHLMRCLISARENYHADEKEEMSKESQELSNSPEYEDAWKKMVQWLERHAT